MMPTSAGTAINTVKVPNPGSSWLPTACTLPMASGEGSAEARNAPSDISHSAELAAPRYVQVMTLRDGVSWGR